MRFLRILLDIVLPRDQLVKKLEEMSSIEFSQIVPRGTKNSIFSYQHPLVRRAIWEIKFRNNRTVLRMVAGAAARHWPPLPDSALFIPLPLSAERLRERGYNQVEELAKEIQLKIPYHLELATDVLKRVVHKQAQTRVPTA